MHLRLSPRAPPSHVSVVRMGGPPIPTRIYNGILIVQQVIFFHSAERLWSSSLTEMKSGVCVCVLLAAFSGSCLGQLPKHSQGGVLPASIQVDAPLARMIQHGRNALDTIKDPQKALQQGWVLGEDKENLRATLSELLAQLLSRKGLSRRNATINSRVNGLSPSHRIQDRDYLGWMDFGRRSAEEYDYTA
ncbi:cholecystokinin [Arapaima gigas]